MTYLLVSLFSLFLSGWLFKKAAGSLNPFKPNLISYIFYYNFFLQSFVGSVLIINDLDYRFYFNDEVSFWGWAAIQYMLVVTPIGMILAKSAFLRKQSVEHILNSYVSSAININFSGGRSLKWSVWAVSLISIFSCLYVFWIIGYYPFSKFLQLSAHDLATTRIESAREFSGNVYIKNLLALSFTPFLSYVWFFYYKATKSFFDLIMFSVVFLMSLGILYYDFSKSPVLKYLISFVFAYFYLDGRSRKFAFFSCLGLVLVLIVLLYLNTDQSFSVLLRYNFGPVGRVILSQQAGLYNMFSIFPDIYDHIGFSSLSGFLADIFGYQGSLSAARLTMMHVNPEGIADGTAGVQNTLFIGEAWANFGLVGVLLSPLWVGFCVQTLYIYILKSDKNPLFLAFFVFYSVGGSITGGLNAYIYNPEFITYIIYITLILFFALFLRQSLRTDNV